MGSMMTSPTPPKMADSGHPLVRNPQEVGDPGEDGKVIVIAVDQSKQAERAFDWYVCHLHRPGHVVRIVHCQDMYSQIAFLPDIKPEKIAIEFDEQRELSQRIIAKYADKLRHRQLPGSVFVDVGMPGNIIVDYANKNKASMIVMGSRGFGVVRRTILGSISQYVVTHSNVPVTIIPKETRVNFF